MHANLSALVVHDIKNSLALLEIDLEQLNHHPDVPPEGRKAYQRCMELKNRLINFLTLYKHDQGGLRPNLREVELTEFLEDMAGSSLSAAMSARHGRSIAVRVDRKKVGIAPDVKLKGSAWFDEYLVDMALESALNNAVRYAQSGVDIWFEQRADSVTFFVLDDGPGVTLVEEVEQRAPLDHASSTGLGLALCKAVAAAHGAGSVLLTNAPDRGALFMLELRNPK